MDSSKSNLSNEKPLVFVENSKVSELREIAVVSLDGFSLFFHSGVKRDPLGSLKISYVSYISLFLLSNIYIFDYVTCDVVGFSS
jgi:hypothetical protein